MHYYQHNIGDYRKDTGHLTLLEHGIYRQLLDTYYTEESPLTTDLNKLMRSHSVRNADEVQAFENVLNDFFKLTEKGYVHDRCDKELEKIYGKSESARVSANARWANRNKDIDANAMQTQSEGNANGMLPINPLPNNPIPNNLSNTILVESKIPPCPHSEIINIYHEVLPELPRVVSWNKTREGYLKQRWRQMFIEFECKDTEDGLDWFRNDFFAFVKGSKFLTGKIVNKDRKPFLADLEWMIKPTNFTKIIERKYEN